MVTQTMATIATCEHPLVPRTVGCDLFGLHPSFIHDCGASETLRNSLRTTQPEREGLKLNQGCRDEKLFLRIIQVGSVAWTGWTWKNTPA